MTYLIDIQNACSTPSSLTDAQFIQWATLALRDLMVSAELTIRLVETDEIKTLNTTYRNQPKATNVLAFPASIPDMVTLECPLIGDIIICPEVLVLESETLETPLVAHAAHITIHGVLHLLGYDHIEEDDEKEMQAIEIKLLAELNYANPYTP